MLLLLTAAAAVAAPTLQLTTAVHVLAYVASRRPPGRERWQLRPPKAAGREQRVQVGHAAQALRRR